MKGNMFVCSLIFVFLLSVFSVEGAVRSGALSSGYHIVFYSGSIESADDSLDYVNVLPRTFSVGFGDAGLYMTIVGDSGGNYTFNTMASGSRFVFADPVSVNGVLVSTGGVNAAKFCDVNGANCINVSQGVPVTGSCGANQYVVRTTTSGVVCASVTSVNVSGDVVGGVCPSGQYVTVANASHFLCSTPASGDVSLWNTSGDDIYYDGDGNVGIGTNSPSELLTVNGNIYSTGTISSDQEISTEQGVYVYDQLGDAVASMSSSGVIDGTSLTLSGSISSGAIVATSVSPINQKVCYASSSSSFANAVAVPVGVSWTTANCKAYASGLSLSYYAVGCVTTGGSTVSSQTPLTSVLLSISDTTINSYLSSLNCGWTASSAGALIGGKAQSDCTNAGGTVIAVTGGNICRFNTYSCSAVSSQWTQYQYWSTTLGDSCAGGCELGCCGTSVSVSGHAWANTDPSTESKTFEVGYCYYPDDLTGGCYTCWNYYETCDSTVTQVGCI